jgi:hypothetical protein
MALKEYSIVALASIPCTCGDKHQTASFAVVWKTCHVLRERSVKKNPQRQFVVALE